MALLTPEQIVQLEGYIVRLRQIAESEAADVNFGDIPRIVGGELCYKWIHNGKELKAELETIIHALVTVVEETKMGRSVTIPQGFDWPTESRGVSSGSCR